MRSGARPHLVLAGLLALALLACTAPVQAPAETPVEPSPAPTATPWPEPTATPKPYQGEGPWELNIQAEDGVSLPATLYGQGTSGLLLLPAYPGGAVGWNSFAGEVAATGMRVLSLEFRETASGAPDLSAARGDIRAAVAFLRSTEVERFFIFAAGESSIPAILEAPQLDGLAGLVLLSPPQNYEESSLSDVDLSALQMPTLWVAARFDLTHAVEALYDGAGGADKTLWIYEGSALRGTYLFESAEGPDLSARLLAFMATATP